MNELRRALDDIDVIRGRLAQAMEFRGYGPTTVAATGILALLVALIESRWPQRPSFAGPTYLVVWIGTAAVSVTLIGIETLTRVRRVYAGLAMTMLHSAVEQFLAPILTGFLLTVVLLRSAPQTVWMLPGLWQLLFSLGVFSSSRFLPRPTFAIGVWYLATGLACLALGGGKWAFSPWEMGIPFGIGQLLVAGMLQFGFREPADP